MIRLPHHRGSCEPDTVNSTLGRWIAGRRAVLARYWFDATFHPFAVCAKSLTLALGYLLLRRVRWRAAVRMLLDAHRDLQKLVIHRLRTGAFGDWLEARIRAAFAPGGGGHRAIEVGPGVSKRKHRTLVEDQGIVLKAPRLDGGRVVEKGVLLLAYNESIETFWRCVDVAAFMARYRLVLEPSWAAYARAWLLYFTRFADPVVVMAPEPVDHRFLTSLGTNIVPSSLGACDWVNPLVFRPLPAKSKVYDAVMVARASRFKRHHVLFRALREMRDPGFRVALVGIHPGAPREAMERLLHAYDVRASCDVFERCSQERVNELLNQSKVNVILSLKEGANQALFEGFFAGVPGLALGNALGLARHHFTKDTGRLIEEHDLVDALAWFRNHWQDFDPRRWAELHITPNHANARLNEQLRTIALDAGEPWTCDIVAKWNSPWPRYYPDPGAGAELPALRDVVASYAMVTPRAGVG